MHCGGLVGLNTGNVFNCGNESGVLVLNDTTALTSWSIADYAGGLIGGMSAGNVSGVYNKAQVKAIVSDKNCNQTYCGGVIGAIEQWNGNTVVSSCYNHGEVSGSGYQLMIGGCVGGNNQYEDNTTTIRSSYNKGEITTTGTAIYIGGVAGWNGYDNNSGKAGKIEKCYCTTKTSHLYKGLSPSTQNRVKEEVLKTYASVLGEDFMNDIQNQDGTWKYGEGYPVLKWQDKIK